MRPPGYRLSYRTLRKDKTRDATAPKAPAALKDRKDPKTDGKKSLAAPVQNLTGNDSLPRSESRCSDADANMPAGMRACRWFMLAKGCREEGKCDMRHDKETKKQADKKNGKSADTKAKAKAKGKAKDKPKDNKKLKGCRSFGGSNSTRSQSSRNGRSGSALSLRGVLVFLPMTGHAKHS